MASATRHFLANAMPCIVGLTSNLTTSSHQLAHGQQLPRAVFAGWWCYLIGSSCWYWPGVDSSGLQLGVIPQQLVQGTKHCHACMVQSFTSGANDLTPSSHHLWCVRTHLCSWHIQLQLCSADATLHRIPIFQHCGQLHSVFHDFKVRFNALFRCHTAQSTFT